MVVPPPLLAELRTWIAGPNGNTGSNEEDEEDEEATAFDAGLKADERADKCGVVSDRLVSVVSDDSHDIVYDWWW